MKKVPGTYIVSITIIIQHVYVLTIITIIVINNINYSYYHYDYDYDYYYANIINMYESHDLLAVGEFLPWNSKVLGICTAPNTGRSG